MKAHVRIWPAAGEIHVVEDGVVGFAIVSSWPEPFKREVRAGRVTVEMLTTLRAWLLQDAQQLEDVLRRAGADLGALEEWT